MRFCICRSYSSSIWTLDFHLLVIRGSSLKVGYGTGYSPGTSAPVSGLYLSPSSAPVTGLYNSPSSQYNSPPCTDYYHQKIPYCNKSPRNHITKLKGGTNAFCSKINYVWGFRFNQRCLWIGLYSESSGIFLFHSCVMRSANIVTVKQVRTAPSCLTTCTP